MNIVKHKLVLLCIRIITINYISYAFGRFSNIDLILSSNRYKSMDYIYIIYKLYYTLYLHRLSNSSLSLMLAIGLFYSGFYYVNNIFII